MYADIWSDRLEKSIEVQRIAEELNTTYTGENLPITGFSTLDTATSSDISFYKAGYEDLLKETDASTVLAPSELNADNTTIIHTENPKSDFVYISNLFFLERSESGIHQSAIVSPDADIGDDCLIGPNVTIGENVNIGDRCVIGSGTTIGQPGFGYQQTLDEKSRNMHHQGSVHIEDEVHIGANCTIDRSVAGATVIGTGTKLHHMVHVAHNVDLGSNNLMNQFCSISGSVVTGDRVRIHPHAVISSHTSIGNDATIGANSTVLEDVGSEVVVVGSPATPIDS